MKRGIKQLFFTTVGVFALVIGTHAQSFKQGDNVVTLGYGFPNLGKSVLKLSETVTDNKAFGIGPVHLKYEHAVSDKVGLGISAGYVAFGSDYDDYDSYSNTTYHYKETVTRLGILARFNYHFANSEKFDPYFGFGAGYNYFNWTDKPTDGGPEKLDIPNIFPVAFEGSIGARYYFTKSIGAYLEVGFGKSLVQAGLAAKF
jgi:outer membrane protein W